MRDRNSSRDVGARRSIKVIDHDEETIRDYLTSLEHPSPVRVFDPATVVHGIDDPIERLRSLAEARRHSEANDLEAAFVDAVVRWSAKNAITKDDFADLGVPAPVLERAFGNAHPRRADSAATYVSNRRVAVAICSKPAGTTMTAAGITDELGASDKTVRKAFKRLTGMGILIETGPDPDYSGPGRPPIIFQRGEVESTGHGNVTVAG